MRTFHVVIESVLQNEYEIDANTSEEAESIAESYFADGEDGAESIMESRVIDAYPIDVEGA